MRILIVEDDMDKLDDIVSCFKDECNYEYVTDMHDATKKLMLKQYDVLLLDLHLPKKLGSRETERGGGVKLLEDIFSSGRLKKPTHIIGLTAHNELWGEYKEKFDDMLVSLIIYDISSDDWKKRIENKLGYVNSWKDNYVIDTGYDFDYAIIAAVEIEFRQVLKLDYSWEQTRIDNDSALYYVGKSKTNLKIVLAKQPQMGMVSATYLSAKLIEKFKPRCLCMVGIAAGIQDKVNICDLIIAEQSWDYGSGKIKGVNEKDNAPRNVNYLFEMAPQSIPISAELRDLFQADYSEPIQEILGRWNDVHRGKEYFENAVKLHIGPVVTGASVVQCEEFATELLKQHRKILALDMETYAVYFSAFNSTNIKPKYISIKSVCDFADIQKGDKYQELAAYLSANFVSHIIDNELIKLN